MISASRVKSASCLRELTSRRIIPAERVVASTTPGKDLLPQDTADWDSNLPGSHSEERNDPGVSSILDGDERFDEESMSPASDTPPPMGDKFRRRSRAHSFQVHKWFARTNGKKAPTDGLLETKATDDDPERGWGDGHTHGNSGKDMDQLPIRFEFLPEGVDLKRPGPKSKQVEGTA